MLWGEHPIGMRRLLALIRPITQPSPGSAEQELSPRPQSDPGAIKRMFPVKYTPKKEGGE